MTMLHITQHWEDHMHTFTVNLQKNYKSIGCFCRYINNNCTTKAQVPDLTTLDIERNLTTASRNVKKAGL